MLTEALFDDPYPVLAELRERGPVHNVRLPGIGDVWLIVGHAEASAALKEPTLVKNWLRAIGKKGPDLVGGSMISSDPPDHARLRRLVSREFTARRIAELAPRVEQATEQLLDRMAAAGGRRDLIADFALPLPVTVICELLGVPEVDRATFAGMCARVFLPSDDVETVRRDIDAVNAYFDTLIDAKRHARDDGLLSALIRVTDEQSDRLSRTELRATTFLLLVAGHVTTTNLIANGVLALLERPAQLAALRADWDLLPGVVEEILRYDTPQPFSTRRFTTVPLRIADTEIPAAATVMVALAAANHDAERFPEADDFDIRRSAGPHLSFGHGIHYCLGAPLARLQVAIALRRLLTRFPGLALAPVAGRDRHRTLISRGLTSLPVLLRPTV